MVIGPVATGVNPKTMATIIGSNHHERKISRNTLENYRPILDSRKNSITGTIQKTKDGLANPFACDELSAEELIYNLFKIPHKSDASIGKLLMVLKNYGLMENDPRLQPMMEKIREIEQEKEDLVHESKDPRHWKLGKEEFKKCIGESLSLIAQTLQNDLIVPSWSLFTQIIKDIYLKLKPMREGKVADYIPQLSRFSADNWGVSICTVDGQRISFGDAKQPFCLQSVSKAFNYAIAASELGAEFVHQHVGQEPSGRLFNEICLDSSNKPHNPMVNSGAIIVTSLIQHGLNMADRFDHVLTQYRKISGGEYVGFNNAVFLSERATADRNFALAYFMKEKNCFPPNTPSLNEALDFYFQLCSLEVTCESASVMAATLANGGVCPISGERCIGSRPCRDVLSLMNSCGMYDYSGQFAFHVGLPAKSGVSGITIVVVPNLLGLALWSPPLDKLGNSCRGVAFCKEMIQRFNFHNYDSLAHNEMQKFDPRRRMGEREKDQVVSLLFAAKAGDLNTVRRMYMQGCDLEIADYDKRTALHLAASEGHLDIIMFLVNTAKVRIDPKDRWNRTPLQDAKGEGFIACVHFLEKCMTIRETHDEDSGTEATPDQHFVPIHSPFSPHSRNRSNSNSSTAPIESVLNTPTPDSLSQKFVPFQASPLANHSCTTGSIQSASVSSSDSESSSSDDDVERHAQVPSPGHCPDQTEISAEQTRAEEEQSINNGDSAYSSPAVQPDQDKNPGLMNNGSLHDNELKVKIPDENHRKSTNQSQVAQKNFANMHRHAQQQHQLRVKLANSPKQ